MNRWTRRGTLLGLLLIGFLLQLSAGAARAQQEPVSRIFMPFTILNDAAGPPKTLHLPLMRGNAPWLNPLSAESWGPYIANPEIREKITELRMGWIRYHNLSWAEVQPEEGGAYNWNANAIIRMDMMLMRAAELGLEPTVIIQDSPHWATVEPTSCAAIRTDKFDDFAAFVTAVVERYSQPPYNVHIWEIGNEPDVDPIWVGPDSGFGCWGDIDDPYYGGEHYGEMLKVVTPAIRAVDPTARVAIGGLLLDTPESTDPNVGHPEKFFEGILVAGAAPYFDILPYHDHYSYTNASANYGGNYPGSKWEDWGGQALGKPTFLRSVMASYGVSKPLWLNETTMRCPSHLVSCQGALTSFEQTQASYVLREVSRTFSAKAERFSWYTLHGPGWQFSGLLDGLQVPRPAFEAFDVMSDQLYGMLLPPVPVDYGPGLEAYRFNKQINAPVDVIFSPGSVYQYASVPVDKFIEAFTLYGAPIFPGAPVQGNYQFFVGYEPVYIHRQP